MPDVKLFEKYVGLRYVHKGRDISGVDCWGLVRLVYSDLGFNVRDIDEYEFKGNLSGHDYFQPRDEWIKNESYKAYDLALFVDDKGIAYHVGIVTPDHRLIHASDRTGVAIMSLHTALKLMKLEGYYHLKGRDDNN